MTYQVKIQALEEFGTVVIKTVTPEVFVQVKVPPPASRSKVVIIAKGDKGDDGDQGPVGPVGETGPQGPIGVTGPAGPQGPQGDIGPQGQQGERGLQGIQGEQGPQGVQGDRGLQGVQGPQGIQGIQGPTGPAGATGATGATGPQGPTGPAGADATTTIADVTLTAADLPTYPASANATTDVVTLTGYNPTAGDTFYLEVPQGATGPTFGDSVNRVFVNEWVGPVLYAVSAGGNTCKLAATKGGTALDISAAGSGWTLRRAGVSFVTSSGLTGVSAGMEVEIISIDPNGIGWDQTNADTLRLQIDNNTGTVYKQATGEQDGLFPSSGVGNINSYSRCTLTHCGTYMAGQNNQIGLTGTTPAAADSIPRNAAPASCSYNPNTAVTFGSVKLYQLTLTANIKLGHRTIIRRFN